MSRICDLLRHSFLFIQYDNTPLGVAAKLGRKDFIKLLLLYPFDVNGRDKVGMCECAYMYVLLTRRCL